MKIGISNFIFWILIVNCLEFIPNIHTFFFNGFEYRDLESNDPTNFAIEASYWTSSTRRTTNIYSTCAGTYLVGGYGVLGTSSTQQGYYFERKFSGLPHNFIFFKMRFWAIDSWDAGQDDHFILRFDNTDVRFAGLDYEDFPGHVCGKASGFWPWNVYKDLQNLNLFGGVAHSGSTLTLRIVASLNDDTQDESFGFRDIVLIPKISASTGQHICSNAPISISSYNCLCSTGSYRSGSNCLPCNSACSACYGPSTSDCYECSSTTFWDGNQCVTCHPSCKDCYGSGADQCVSCNSGGFLWNGNTCINQCNPPLKSFNTADGLVCDFPCAPGWVLEQWGTNQCRQTCDLPYTRGLIQTSQGNVETCNLPCPTGQYLYWDRSCKSTCPPPLQPTSNATIPLVCVFPCNPPNNILYWQGTCDSKCDLPLSYEIESSRVFCRFPCVSGKFLYNNGSCLTNCQQYFTSSSFLTKPRCDYPCTSSEFLYSNGSCLSSCQPHFDNFTIITDKHCNFPCDPSKYLYNNGSCIASCDARFLSGTLVGEKYCNYPCPKDSYLYLNGSCITSCRGFYIPKRDEVSGDLYCERPCSSGDYLLNNGTCTSICPAGFQIVTEGTDKFCNFPCPNSQYLHKNLSCLSDCPPHFIPRTYGNDRFCDYPCKTGEYLYNNGTCLASCILPLILRTHGSDTFCDYPCQTGDYLYKNGSCLSYCAPHFIESIYGREKYCDFPCASGEYLNTDGFCMSACPPYFILQAYGSDRFCKYPCATNKYLYDNGSCLSSCHSLFQQTISNNTSEKYCHHPCPTTSDFIYWNGTCKPFCLPPLKQYVEAPSTSGGGYKFCTYPCSASQFLYWNGSCIDECKYPLVSTKLQGLKYCNYPCSSSEYLSWDGSCISSCQSPFKVMSQGQGTLCTLPCSDPGEYYYEDSKKCKEECTMQSVVEQDLFRKCIPFYPSTNKVIKYLSTPSPDESYLFKMKSLAKMIQQIRHLNISLPSRLEQITFTKSSSPLTLIYHFPISIVQSQNLILPLIFEKYNLSSSFIPNFAQELISLGIFLLGSLIAKIGANFSFYQGWDGKSLIFERISVVLKNIIAMHLALSIDDIVIYSSFEFKYFELNSPLDLVSLIVCIITVITAIGLLCITCFLSFEAQAFRISLSKKGSVNSYSEFLARWQGLQVLYRGFKYNKPIQSLFYLVYTLRVAFPALIASYLYISPQTQSVLYLLLSLGMMSYLLIYNPLKKRVSQIQILLLELLILVVNVGLVLLAYSELIELDNMNTRILIGDIIICCNFIINILPLIFFPIKAIIIAKAAILQSKKQNKNATALWYQMLFLPFQQGAFGFEQVQIVSFDTGNKVKLAQAEETKSSLGSPNKQSVLGSDSANTMLKSPAFSKLAQVFRNLRQAQPNKNTEFSQENLSLRRNHSGYELSYASKNNIDTQYTLPFESESDSLTNNKILIKGKNK